MCSCVPCEVLRQCSATNPADIIIYVLAMTVLGLRKKSHFIFHARIDTAVCLCVYYINT